MIEAYSRTSSPVVSTGCVWGDQSLQRYHQSCGLYRLCLGGSNIQRYQHSCGLYRLCLGDQSLQRCQHSCGLYRLWLGGSKLTYKGTNIPVVSTGCVWGIKAYSGTSSPVVSTGCVWGLTAVPAVLWSLQVVFGGITAYIQKYQQSKLTVVLGGGGNIPLVLIMSMKDHVSSELTMSGPVLTMSRSVLTMSRSVLTISGPLVLTISASV